MFHYSQSNIELDDYSIRSQPATYDEAEDSQPFVPASLKGPDPVLSTARTRHFHHHTRPAWFNSVTVGLMLSLVVLIVNIAILAWTSSSFSGAAGILVMYTGSCSQTSLITGAAELAINVMSTLILTASNTCAQLLGSPTRAELDMAHASGSWLHIGTHNLGTFRWIKTWRVILCFLLFVSSIPLHLVYNSVIFSSTYTNDYVAVAVTENFANGGWWDQTAAMSIIDSPVDPSKIDLQISDTKYDEPKTYLNQIALMQNSTQNLSVLDNDKCKKAYGADKLQPPYLNVLLVTNYTQNDSVVDILFHFPENGNNDEVWFTSNTTDKGAVGKLEVCTNFTYGAGVNWTIPVCNECDATSCPQTPAHIQHCLAQPAGAFEPQCTISISKTLLITVIICNAVKVACLALTLLARNFHPLATVGDAIDSLMARPDVTTFGCGPLSIFNIRQLDSGRSSFSEKVKAQGDKFHVWRETKYKWGYAISTPFCCIGLFLLVLAWVLVLIATITSWAKGGPTIASWSHESTYASAELGTSKSGSLLSNVLTINAPQLVVSFVYIFYMFLITRMVIAHEYSKFATQAKTIRVLHPSRDQQSTHLLTLPFKYMLPIMAGMAVLHWLISRGIYLVNIKVYNVAGQEEPARAHLAYATSALALLLALVVGTAMLSPLFALMYRRLKSGMPIIGTCSAAISAACHPIGGDEDAATRVMVYGVLGELESSSGRGPRGPEIKHVGFSRSIVAPLREGHLYY